MKRIAVLAVLFAVLAAPASATAHVQEITPLFGLSCHVDNSTIGANRTNGMHASAANGGPITGLIPTDVRDAPLMVGDGSFGATTANCDAG